MRAAWFVPSFLQKRGVIKGGWVQVGSSHFNEKNLIFIGHCSMRKTIMCEKENRK